MTDRYATPQAFKQALEQRLRDDSPIGVARARQQLVFDRFLARVGRVLGDAVTLKGGLVLELRLHRARSTRDLDLRVIGSPDEVLANLQLAGRTDLGDFMAFEVARDAKHSDIDGARYAGLRHRVECKLAGKLYGQPFGVDVGFADPIVGKPDVIRAADTLGFAGVEPPTVRLYPIVSHVAEKLHAYTLPRSRPNTRVKDLPDLALLSTVCQSSAAELRRAIDATFEFRGTHAVPTEVPEPPTEWELPYRRMAARDELPWTDLAELVSVVRGFLGPALRVR